MFRDILNFANEEYNMRLTHFTLTHINKTMIREFDSDNRLNIYKSYETVSSILKAFILKSNYGKMFVKTVSRRYLLNLGYSDEAIHYVIG